VQEAEDASNRFKKQKTRPIEFKKQKTHPIDVVQEVFLSARSLFFWEIQGPVRWIIIFPSLQLMRQCERVSRLSVDCRVGSTWYSKGDCRIDYLPNRVPGTEYQESGRKFLWTQVFILCSPLS